MTSTFENAFRQARYLCAIGLISACSLSGNQPLGYGAQINVGEQFLRNGQYNQGYAMLEDVASRNEGSSEVYLALGDSYFRVGAYLRAEDAYTIARRNGADVAGIRGLGRVSLARNDTVRAKRYFESILEQVPNDVVALNGLGVANDIDGNHSFAQNIYRNALAIAPTDKAVTNNLGLSLALSGRNNEAISYLSPLTRSNLDNPTARQNLAIAYAGSGQSDAAVQLAQADIPQVDAQRLFAAIAAYSRQVR